MYKNRKVVYIIGGVVGFLIVAAAILAVALSFGSESKYDKYFNAAQNAYVTGDFDGALESIELALGVEQTAECYLLMADIYEADNNTHMALQVLYLGYSKLGSEDIMQKINVLEDGQPDSEDVPVVSGVVIAGSEYPEDATSLVLANKGLKTSDLHSLYEFDRLESLSLANNEIRDISSLADLTTLTFLDVTGNLIEDITALKSLENLKTLYIDANPISDIALLHSLTSLRTLSMKGITISTSELEALEKALPDCNIFADDAIEEAVEITLGGKTFMSDVTELDLRGLGITDISALSQCTKLIKLDLRNNNIEDITPLIDCADLEWLSIWNNKVTNLAPLMNLQHLKYLDADQNQITDVSFLSYATDIEELWISGNPIKSIKHVGNLEKLRRLGVKGLNLTDEDIEMLAGITTLQELRLEDNMDITMNAIDEFKEAVPACAVYYSEGLASKIALGSGEFLSTETVIDASGLGITSLDGIEEFDDLVSINLADNSLSDITALAQFSGLQILSLKNCGISDVSALSSCRALTSLDLSGNNVSSISVLLDLTSLTNLDLSGNSALTADDIRELNAALPKCNIITDIDFSEEESEATENTETE